MSAEKAEPVGRFLDREVPAVAELVDAPVEVPGRLLDPKLVEVPVAADAPAPEISERAELEESYPLLFDVRWEELVDPALFIRLGPLGSLVRLSGLVPPARSVLELLRGVVELRPERVGSFAPVVPAVPDVAEVWANTTLPVSSVATEINET